MWKLKFKSNQFDMVPPQDNSIYGDLTSTAGKPGQGTPTPSEKVFGFHFIVKPVISGLVPAYYDPSYGVPYTDQDNFENVAVDGYVLPAQVLNDPPLVYRVKKSLGLKNIQFDH